MAHGKPRHRYINKTHFTAIDCSRFAEAQRLDTHDGPEKAQFWIFVSTMLVHGLCLVFRARYFAQRSLVLLLLMKTADYDEDVDGRLVK